MADNSEGWLRKDGWREVVCASEGNCSCEEPGCRGECGMDFMCPCGDNYAECDCIGPTEDEEEVEYLFLARRLKNQTNE